MGEAGDPGSAPDVVRALEPGEVERVVTALGLARLHQGDGFYLVAWRDQDALGHLHLALTDPPELQDVEVAQEHQRRGVATMLIHAAEGEARARGFASMRVTVGIDNEPARQLYRKCGYEDVGIPPHRVKGTVDVRTGPIEVDDVLLTWEKNLAEDPGAKRPAPGEL